MADEFVELAEAVNQHAHATRDYIHVENQLRAGLPPLPRRRRWSPLLAVLLLVLCAPLAVVGRAHFVPTPAAPAGSPGWPDASNTGVPSGTVLTAYTGPCVITTANTVINAKQVDNCPDGMGVLAGNVQITNSKINTYLTLDPDRVDSSTYSLTITDSEIDAGLRQIAALGAGNLTATRVNVHGGGTALQCEANSDGVQTGYCILRDSYLHGQQRPDDGEWHLGGILTEGGLISMEITHNTVFCDAVQSNTGNGCSGSINLLPWFGPAQNITITNNKLSAEHGSYCTYGGSSATPYQAGANNIKYVDNVFVRGITNQCAVFGPVTDFNSAAPGNVWTNNRYDTGELIGPTG